MKNLLLLLTALALFFSGCTQQIERISEILITAELMNTDPENAIHLIGYINREDTVDLKKQVPFELVLPNAEEKEPGKAIFESLARETYLYLDTVDQDKADQYLRKCLISDQIMMKAVAYKYLAEKERAAHNYEKAFVYMDQYIALKDTIHKAGEGKVKEELSGKYDVEKLSAENFVLELKKTQNKKIYLMIVSLLFFLFLVSSLISGSIIKRKEKELIENQRLVQEYNSKILENEMIIKENQKLLAQKDLQLNEIRERMSENEKLEAQNQLLKEKIRKKEELYNQYLEKSKSEYVQENQELVFKFDKLKRRKEILLEQVIRKNSLLSRLHNAPESEEQFTEKDLRELIVIVNKLYDGFANRLQMKYGELTQEEIQYCCLLKIKMKPKQIAAIFKIKPDNVYKRKQRIKEKIGLENSKLEDLLNELEFEE